MTDEEFHSTVEAFIARYHLTPTTFGLWAMNDSRFVFDIREGRLCFGKTIRRVLRFMQEYEQKQEDRRRRQAIEETGSAVSGIRTTFAAHAHNGDEPRSTGSLRHEQRRKTA